MMSGYFKPLRRKVGVATLTLACGLAACWVRSFFVSDEFVTNQYKMANAVVSSPEGIRFEIRHYFDGYFPQNGFSSAQLKRYEGFESVTPQGVGQNFEGRFNEQAAVRSR